MIVGMALLKIFEGFTLNVDNNDVSVQFHFGKQDEYNKWVSQMRYNKQKYPLIWYVSDFEDEQKNGTITTESQLILFMGTKQNYNNIERYNYNFVKYLDPLYKKVNKFLERHRDIVLYENPIKLIANEPNFGKNNDNDFDSNSSRKKDPKSIGIDIVDAKVFKIKMNINTNCILQ
jgi:hypothetical protein